MIGFRKRKNSAQIDVNSSHKHRFERPHNNHQSDWRSPQGAYVHDVDAKKRVLKLLTVLLKYSQILSVVLMIIIASGMGYMILFGNYENVILDDGSRLFCTVLEDGSIGIAY